MLISKHKLAPDWAKKELCLEYELIQDSLHRMDEEQAGFIEHAHRANFLKDIDAEEYWTRYIKLVEAIRHYAQTGTDQSLGEMRSMDRRLNAWRMIGDHHGF